MARFQELRVRRNCTPISPPSCYNDVQHIPSLCCDIISSVQRRAGKMGKASSRCLFSLCSAVLFANVLRLRHDFTESTISGKVNRLKWHKIGARLWGD